MGWRDRDWGKFDEQEWNALLGSSTTTTLPSGQVPASHSRRGRPFVGWAVTLAALVSFGATVGVDAVHRLRGNGPSLAAPPPNVVAIHWRDGDVSPALGSGRICVDDARLGEVCANYVAGEKPADVLTRRIEALGASVQSG